MSEECPRRLHSRMRDEGLRVWFDEEDIQGGRERHPQIDEAIRAHDKLLLVLSEASMKSTWVATEIRRTRLAEKREGKRKLFPIRLVDYKLIEGWELGVSSGEDMAEVVRQFYIPDFTNWRVHDALGGVREAAARSEGRGSAGVDEVVAAPLLPALPWGVGPTSLPLSDDDPGDPR
jgi:hypothetical protein